LTGIEIAGGVRGRVEIEVLAPGVVLYRMCGYLDSSIVPQFVAAAAAQVARGRKVTLFFDTDTMTGNDSAFRHRMTEWHNNLKPETLGLHVYLRSKLIAMSVSVVNLVTGGMLKPYTKRDEFAAAMQEAISAAST
jgi:hypothetical protein